VWCCLCDPTFSRFSRTPTCDGRADGQTDTRRQLIPALASVARVKTGWTIDRVEWPDSCGQHDRSNRVPTKLGAPTFGKKTSFSYFFLDILPASLSITTPTNRRVKEKRSKTHICFYVQQGPTFVNLVLVGTVSLSDVALRQVMELVM